MQAWQVFVEIPGKPPVELPEGEAVVGRSRTCAVHIPESTVSRQHAKLLVGTGGKVLVRDLGSSNGTFVNGDKIEGEKALANGDRVTVGEAEVIVRILPPVEPAEATMKVHLPPMTAPQVGETQRFEEGAVPPPPPAAPTVPPPPSQLATAVGAPLSAAVTAPPRPMAPPPPPLIDPPLRREPAVTVPPPLAPVAKASAAPTAAEQKAGDLLPSIQEIEKMPLPPPKKGGAPAVHAPAPGATVAVEPAGFWIRVAANLVDGVLFGLVYAVIFVLGFVLALVAPPEIAITLSSLLTFAAGLGVAFLLGIYFPATKGQTPGKKLLGLWIYSDETPAGRGLGYGKAGMRFVGHMVCSFTFGLGYLMVAFTSRKQGLHDLIAKTYVGKKR